MEVVITDKYVVRRPCDSSFGLVPVYLVMVRIGRATAQSVASLKLSGALSNLCLGEAVASNVALSGRAQIEALLYLVSRVSTSSPGRLAWIIRKLSELLTRCVPVPVGSTASVTSWLARQSLLRQVQMVGLHAGAVSAISTMTVQVSLHACVFACGSLSEPDVAAAQFAHDFVTAVASGVVSVLGGGCGAAVGGLLLPGIGTALGSLGGSFGGGLLPYLLRREGPRARRERARQVAERQGLERALRVVEEPNGGWLLIADCEGDVVSMYFGRMAPDEARGLMDDDDDAAYLSDYDDVKIGLVEEVPDADEEFVEITDAAAAAAVEWDAATRVTAC